MAYSPIPVVPNTPPVAPIDKPPAASKFWIFLSRLLPYPLNLTLVYLVLRVWPEKIRLRNDPAIVKIIPGHFEPSMYMEIRYLCIVGLVGALGAFIHLTTSFHGVPWQSYFCGQLEVVVWTAALHMVRPSPTWSIFAARGGLILRHSGAKDLSP